MKAFGKWLERLYLEQDFGRGMATSVAGAVVLVVYLFVGDGVIAVSSGVICYPMVRILASTLRERTSGIRNERKRRGKQDRKARLRKERALQAYEQLSYQEQATVQVFVDQGGCVIPQDQAHELCLSDTCIESLRKRKLLEGSTTADGYRAIFVLNADLFDVAQEQASKNIPF